MHMWKNLIDRDLSLNIDTPQNVYHPCNHIEITINTIKKLINKKHANLQYKK